MSKHNHPKPKKEPVCPHIALRHCKQCDAVECSACGKEWVLECKRNHPSPDFERLRRELPYRPSDIMLVDNAAKVNHTHFERIEPKFTNHGMDAIRGNADDGGWA